MMFEAMFFLFCPIHIKHQTFNFKLKKRLSSCDSLFLYYFFRFGVQSMMMLPGCFMTVKFPFVEDRAFSKVLLCHFSTPIWEPPTSFDEADCF